MRAAVRLPRSKSVANRALVLAFLAGDLSCVNVPGDAADTRILQALLRERPHRMHCGAGGTTFRFLLAWACVQAGEEHVLTGDARLLERPHDALIEALRQLGADIERTEEGLRVRGRRLKGGTVHFHSPISSQYLSALLLVAPTFEEGLELRWTGTRLSEPYVEMTLRMLATFGVTYRSTADGVEVPPGRYARVPFIVPPDWSSAAFWFEVVALSAGAEVLLQSLTMDPLQGDREAAYLWSPWVRREATDAGLVIAHRTEPGPWTDAPVDLAHVPDLFQPLAFTCAARGLGATFTGLDNLPLKETDRLAAVSDALASLGVRSAFRGGTLTLYGPSGDRWVDGPEDRVFDPCGDHRMAMSLAPLAMVREAITVLDPEVVGKSYPTFWDDLRIAGFRLSTP